MTTATVTKIFTLQMGHRLPNHNGKCRNLHGHSYSVEVSVAGNVQEEPGSSQGMVVDFNALKAAWIDVDAQLDHRMLLWEKDPLWQFRDAEEEGHTSTLADFGAIDFPMMPTAENIARYIFDMLEGWLDKTTVWPLGTPAFTVHQVKVWETATSWAAYSGE